MFTALRWFRQCEDTGAGRRPRHDRSAGLSLQYRLVHILRSLHPLRGAVKPNLEETQAFNMAQLDHGTLG
jgi:hypothetical protein